MDNAIKRPRGRPRGALNKKTIITTAAGVGTHKAFSDSWAAFKSSEKFKSLIASMNRPDKYNENILWWAFEAGFNANKQQHG